jgi:putative colanic acid biosynthesis UDP-glucose lipid carrier transferase
MRALRSYATLPDVRAKNSRISIPLRTVPILISSAYALSLAVAAVAAQTISPVLLDGVAPLTAVQATAIAVATGTLLIAMLQIGGLTAPDKLAYGRPHIQKLLGCLAFSALLVGGLVAAVDLGRDVRWPPVFIFFGLVAVFAFLGHLTMRVIVRRALTAGIIRGPRIALISSCRIGVQEMAAEFDRFGYSVARKLDLPRDADAEQIQAVARSAVAAVRGSAIEEVLIAVDCVSVKLARPLMELLRATPLPVRLVLNAKTTELFAHNPRSVGGMSTFEIQRPPLSFTELFCKRVLDVTVAGSALVLLSPLIVLTCIAVKLDSKGPAFFRQTRNGFNGRSFTILKFRSMTVQENGSTIVQATKNDARVTRVGRILRRTSVDELPQLWNVLSGHMSIVGPRPHATAHDQYYASELGNYAFRQHVAPGLTGWAQVHGFRGETSTVDDMNQRLQHDIWYIDHWSLWLDLQILLRTPIELLRARNAY